MSAESLGRVPVRVRDRWLAIVAVAVLGGFFAGLLVGGFWLVVDATSPA